MTRRFVPMGALIAIAAIFGSVVGTTPYPWAGTAFFSLLVMIGTLILWLILGAQWPLPMWARALVAMLLFLVVLWYSAQDTLGAPAYVFVHQAWLVAIILTCLGLVIWRPR